MFLVITVWNGNPESVRTYEKQEDFERVCEEKKNAGWGQYKEGAVDGTAIFSAGANDPCYDRKYAPWTQYFIDQENKDMWHIPVLNQ